MRKKLAVLVYLLAGVVAAQKSDGFLKVKADPGRTGVIVDGKYLGPAANFGVTRKYAVAAGEHEVKLADPRYQDASQKVSITAGKTTTITEKMKPAPLAQPPYGILKTPAGMDKYTAVYVNDKFYGHTDEFDNFAQGLLLPPGSYNVKLVSVNGSPVKEEKVTLEANKVTQMKK
jgi:hypothetical protein